MTVFDVSPEPIGSIVWVRASACKGEILGSVISGGRTIYRIKTDVGIEFFAGWEFDVVIRPVPVRSTDSNERHRPKESS